MLDMRNVKCKQILNRLTTSALLQVTIWSHKQGPNGCIMTFAKRHEIKTLQCHTNTDDVIEGALPLNLASLAAALAALLSFMLRPSAFFLARVALGALAACKQSSADFLAGEKTLPCHQCLWATRHAACRMQAWLQGILMEVLAMLIGFQTCLSCSAESVDQGEHSHASQLHPVHAVSLVSNGRP